METRCQAATFVIDSRWDPRLGSFRPFGSSSHSRNIPAIVVQSHVRETSINVLSYLQIIYARLRMFATPCIRSGLEQGLSYPTSPPDDDSPRYPQSPHLVSPQGGTNQSLAYPIRQETGCDASTTGPESGIIVVYPRRSR